MHDLRLRYEQRHAKALQPLAANLVGHVQYYLKDFGRIDQITARAKSVDRFIEKAEKTGDDGKLRYSAPLEQIQDQVGVRIVAFYLSDIQPICSVVEDYYTAIEDRVVTPERDAEFGYFGKHYVLTVPTELFDPNVDESFYPECFELQVKTLFQHAWSECDHDLAYKTKFGELSSDERRKLAFTAAQAWGADMIFDELFCQKLKAGGH